MAGEGKSGRHWKLDDKELRVALLREIARGTSLQPACELFGMRYQTLRNYARAHPKFAKALKKAQAHKLSSLAKMAFRRAKKSDKVLSHLLACLDPAFRKTHIESNHNHKHAHVHIGVDEQRNQLAALAAKFGLGNIFGSDASGPPAIDHSPDGSGVGLPAPTGVQEAPINPDATPSGLSQSELS